MAHDIWETWVTCPRLCWVYSLGRTQILTLCPGSFACTLILWLEFPCLLQRRWIRWSLRLPSNLNVSMNLLNLRPVVNISLCPLNGIMRMACSSLTPLYYSKFPCAPSSHFFSVLPSLNLLIKSREDIKMLTEELYSPLSAIQLLSDCDFSLATGSLKWIRDQDMSPSLFIFLLFFTQSGDEFMLSHLKGMSPPPF